MISGMRSLRFSRRLGHVRKAGIVQLRIGPALTGILLVLRSGLPWEMLPAEMGSGSGMSCWRRLRDWQAAGVWSRLHHVLLDRLHAAGEIDWSRACLGSASIPAKKGGVPPARTRRTGTRRASRYRNVRHAARPLHERRQPARQRHNGGDPRCYPVCAERSERTTATSSGQVAR